MIIFLDLYLGFTDGKTVSTLHGDTHFVRTKSCFKCILNFKFRVKLCLVLVNVKYNALQWEIQCCFLTLSNL